MKAFFEEPKLEVITLGDEYIIRTSTTVTDPAKPGDLTPDVPVGNCSILYRRALCESRALFLCLRYCAKSRVTRLVESGTCKNGRFVL